MLWPTAAPPVPRIIPHFTRLDKYPTWWYRVGTMNQTEKKAHAWLTAQGVGGLVFQGRTSPDFVSESGKGYEVKLLRGNTVTFFSNQLEQLSQHGDVIILIFNKKNDDPVAKFRFNGYVDIPGYWKNIHLKVVSTTRGVAPSMATMKDVQTWLQQTGRTQTWLAKRAGIAAPYLSRMFNGSVEPSQDVLKSLQAVIDEQVERPQVTA